MCNDSQLVCIFVAPKVISNVPQSGQNTTRQSALPARLTFLCCLFEFIDFTIPILGRMESAEATVCSVSLTLAGFQQLKVLDDGWLFFTNYLVRINLSWRVKRNRYSSPACSMTTSRLVLNSSALFNRCRKAGVVSCFVDSVKSRGSIESGSCLFMGLNNNDYHLASQHLLFSFAKLLKSQGAIIYWDRACSSGY